MGLLCATLNLVVDLGLEPSMPDWAQVLQTRWCTRTPHNIVETIDKEPCYKTMEAFRPQGQKTSRCDLELSASGLVVIPDWRLFETTVCSTHLQIGNAIAGNMLLRCKCGLGHDRLEGGLKLRCIYIV